MGFELADGYRCPVCGEQHAPLPLSFSAKAPFAVGELPPSERGRRVVMTADQCVVDQRRYFLRGRILAPLREVPEPFIWGVWAEIAATDFYRTQQRWTTAGRELERAYAGRLASEIPFFAASLGLRLTVQTQPVGQRPHFTVTEELHPLAIQQREGLTIQQVAAMNAALRHGGREFAPTDHVQASQVLCSPFTTAS